VNKGFTYSLLQYKSSLASGESLNVGIVFAFHESNEIEFVTGSLYRIKLVYPDTDLFILKSIIKIISERISDRNTDIFKSTILNNGLSKFLHTQIIRSDSTSLEFSTPTYVGSLQLSKRDAISEFSKILLPRVINEPKKTPKQKEDRLLRNYTAAVIGANPIFDKKLEKSPRITTETIDVKFDLGWKNGTMNLVKALSFDLNDKLDIQTKAITNLGTLTALRQYADSNNIKFDLLIDPPKKEEYFVAYKDALSILKSADTKKEIITNIDEYSTRTIKYLSTTIL
jgi:hypothetical protein